MFHDPNNQFQNYKPKNMLQYVNSFNNFSNISNEFWSGKPVNKNESETINTKRENLNCEDYFSNSQKDISLEKYSNNKNLPFEEVNSSPNFLLQGKNSVIFR